jgi:hypothetical protein
VLINLSIGDEGLQYLCKNSGKAKNVRKLLLGTFLGYGFRL